MQSFIRGGIGFFHASANLCSKVLAGCFASAPVVVLLADGTGSFSTGSTVVSLVLVSSVVFSPVPVVVFSSMSLIGLSSVVVEGVDSFSVLPFYSVSLAESFAGLFRTGSFSHEGKEEHRQQFSISHLLLQPNLFPARSDNEFVPPSSRTRPPFSPVRAARLLICVAASPKLSLIALLPTDGCSFRFCPTAT